MGDGGRIDGEEAQRLDIEQPHRHRVLLKQQAERLLALLEFGDVDADADIAAACEAAFLDANPAAIGPALLLRAAVAGMAIQAIAQPFLFPSDTVQIGAALKPEPQHVPEWHADLHHAIELGIELDIAAVPEHQAVICIEYRDAFPHRRENAAEEGVILLALAAITVFRPA